MSAINFVVRDVAGNISRGTVAGEGVPSSLIVGAGADVSLNLTQGQVLSYTRQGQALQITMLDGRVIVIEGFFTVDGVGENQLFLSADGALVEVDLSAGAGADYVASYGPAAVGGKFGGGDDLYFSRGADVQLADSFVPVDDEVGMLAFGALGPLLGWGGAAVLGTGLVVTNTGNEPPTVPTVTITTGTEGTDHVVNEEDHSDGVDIGGTGDVGTTVDVTIGDTTETTTVGEDGTWGVTFDPEDIETGEYSVPIEVVVTGDGGTTTVSDVLVVDTEIAVTMDPAGGDDGVISGEEAEAGVTVTGTVTGGDAVTVTVGDTVYDAAVTDGTWVVDLPSDIFTSGEYDVAVVVTATDEAGNSTSTNETLVFDTVTSVDMDLTTIGGVDNIVNGVEQTGGVTVTGTAQENSTVEVTFGDAVTTVTTGSDGTWTATFTADQVPTGETSVTVTAVATDSAGNMDSATGTVDIDTLVTELGVSSSAIGGADGVVNYDESQQPITMTGTVEPGSSVIVELGGVATTAVVDDAGNWSVTIPAGTLTGGEYETTAVVTATDGAGNVSVATQDVVVDTLVNELDVTSAPIGGTDGVVNLDESGQSITMTGTVEPGSVVSVDLHGVTTSAIVDQNGNWTATYPVGTLPVGEYETSVTVTATDGAGNTSSLSEAVVVDTVAGDLALSTQPIEIDDVVNAVEASDGVTITGTASVGAVVTVGLGDATMQVTAGPDGTWSADFAAGLIPAGTYDAPITASITDAAGNYKEVSDTVHVDTQVDGFAFSTAPVEGDDVINGAEASDGVVLSGTVEAGSSVVVEFGGQSVTVQAGQDGAWSADFPASAIQGGEYSATMTATATDPAGNVAVITDQVQVDTIVNNLTSSDPVEGDNVVNAAEASDGITLGGTVEAGSSVMVTFEGTSRAATVDGAGNWSVSFGPGEIPAGEYDAEVTIAATDAAGNTESITDTFAVDTVGPEAPEIESVTITEDGVRALEVTDTDNDYSVHSISDAGAVTQQGDQDTAIDLGNSDLFTFNPELSDGTHLVVNETDSAGNENATYVVMQESGTSEVGLAGLDGFDVGSIDLSFAKNTDLTLDLNTLEGLSDANNNLVIHGGDDDSVTLDGATNSGQSATIGNKSYDIYTMGDDAQVFIEEDINVTI